MSEKKEANLNPKEIIEKYKDSEFSNHFIQIALYHDRSEEPNNPPNGRERTENTKNEAINNLKSKIPELEQFSEEQIINISKEITNYNNIESDSDKKEDDEYDPNKSPNAWTSGWGYDPDTGEFIPKDDI